MNIAAVQDPIARMALADLQKRMRQQENIFGRVIQNAVTVIGKATGARIVYQVSAPTKNADAPDIWVKAVAPYTVYHKVRKTNGDWDYVWTAEAP